MTAHTDSPRRRLHRWLTPTRRAGLYGYALGVTAGIALVHILGGVVPNWLIVTNFTATVALVLHLHYWTARHQPPRKIFDTPPNQDFRR